MHSSIFVILHFRYPPFSLSSFSSSQSLQTNSKHSFICLSSCLLFHAFRSFLVLFYFNMHSSIFVFLHFRYPPFSLSSFSSSQSLQTNSKHSFICLSSCLLFHAFRFFLVLFYFNMHSSIFVILHFSYPPFSLSSIFVILHFRYPRYPLPRAYKQTQSIHSFVYRLV